ncbi:MAG: hypothetical protein IJ916_03460 [Paludibacteraceae bacterium]|nr:hypothetical protein [Paludibacteraceae bacterium]
MKQSEKNNFLSSRQFPWVVRAVFFLICLIVLGVIYQDVLYQFFWRNYFIDNPVFAEETINQSAGWMKYCGRYLNQFCYHPWLSAVIIALSLTGIQLIIQRLFDKQEKRIALTYLPSVLLLMIFLTIKYSIFAVFEIGFYFAMIVGVLYTFMQYALYQKIVLDREEIGQKKYLMKAVLFLLVEVLLYPYIGFFSVLPMIMIAIDEWHHQRKWMAGIQIVLFFLLPYICKTFYYTERYLHVMFTPMSDPYFKELLVVNILFVLSVCFMVLLKYRMKQMPKLGTIIIVLAEVGVLCYGMMNDESRMFREEMRLSRLVDEKDWGTVLKNIPKDQQLTHTQNAFRVVALANTDQLMNRLFDMKMPFLKNPSKLSSDMIIYCNDLFYYGSFLSVDLQLNMEQWVLIGESYKGLRHFIELAIMMDDDDLAVRYIDIMRQTLFLKDQADKYKTYLTNKRSFYADYPDYARIKVNVMKEDKILSAHNFFAKNYVKFNYLDGDNIERRLLADLYMKDLDKFAVDFSFVKQRYSKVPQYMQEALILNALLKNNQAYLKIAPIDQQLFYTVKALVEEVMHYDVPKMKEASERLYKKYKNTYSYYYVFNTEDYKNYTIK